MPNLYTTLPTGAYVGTQSMVLTLSPDIAKADISLMFDGEWVQHIVAQYTGSPVTVVLDKPGVCSITAIPRLLSNGDVPVVGTPSEIYLEVYVYTIQLDELLTVISKNPVTGIDEVNGGVIYANTLGEPDCRISLNVGSIPVVQGTITKNGKRVGEFRNQNSLTNTIWYTNVAILMPVRNGDAIEVQVNVPSYSIQRFVVKRDEMTPPKGISVSSAFKEASAFNFFGGKSYVNPAVASKLLFDAINKDIPVTYKVKPSANMTGYLKLLSDFTNNRLQRNAARADIYRTTAAALNAAANAPVSPMYPIIDASTNTVYAFLDGVVKAIPGLKAQDFFGSPRLVDSYIEPGPIVTYLIDTDNQIKPQ